TFTASLSDNVNTAVTKAVTIAVTPAVANNAPAITAFANPMATVAQDAAPFHASFSGSDDNNVFNWSATAGMGISNVAVSGGQGTANATFTVTLQAGFSGTAAFNVVLSDNVNPSVSAPVTFTVTPAPPPPLDHIVISQVYGSGGNSNALYQNDYVEIYNPTTSTADLTGWSLQYSAATNTTWNVQPLGGLIQPGEYYLVRLATNGAIGATVPAANINGDLNLSGTNGKLALVSNGEPLTGCVVGAPVVDLVGYGSTANCREGASNAPSPSTSLAIFRKNGGFSDTNVNGSDFVTGSPNPRRTAVIMELGPAVLNTDPRLNASTAPKDASIIVTFTESVELSENWFDINCAQTGAHNSATLAGGANQWVIIPNVNFRAGEQCTVTILKNGVHDTDLDDSAPNTDTMSNNFVYTFTVASGAAPAYSPDVHLTMGNPSHAIHDVNTPNNYLMVKPEYTLSYNRDRGTPNWVSWHLSDEWIGNLTRVDSFRADPAVPADWYRVTHLDYFGSGFDRGHMVPNADRDPDTSIPINQATFLMSNMIPQAPDNNQGPWAAMENYLRTLLPANELYIVAGGAGSGGTGSSGFISTFANGHITVPASTWKVVLVLPKDSGNDLSRVTAGARTIAVILPNTQGIRNVDWTTYLTTVDQVEALTNYDFFSEVPDPIENAIEAGVNGVNPPGVDNQSISTDEDSARSFTIDVAAANSNALTYTIVSGPSHGTISGSGATQTYTPAPDFNGSDSFTFKVSDGSRSSNTAKMTITVLEVNDTPVANADNQSTSEDTALQFSSSDLTANDAAGPANESNQSLTVSSVTATADTHGIVALTGGFVTYTPAANYNGPASFSYEVCDNGVTRGLASPQCTASTVNVTVNSVNDAPAATLTAPATGVEGSAISASISGSDVDANDTLSYAWSVKKNGAAFANGSGTSINFTPNDNGSYEISVVVTDAAGATGSDTKTVAVTNAAPALTTVSGPNAALSLGTAASINFTFSDAGAGDTHTATLMWDDGTTSTVACAARVCSATHTFTAAGTYGVAIVLGDDDGATAAATFNYVIVYDVNAGSVTGGGTIDTPTGRATLNVNAQYLKNRLSGNTQFKLAGNEFRSTSYEWLVVNGGNAQYKGAGTINGIANYDFLVTVSDGAVDKFRIKIWERNTGTVVYDNATGASDDLDAANPQPIATGNITVHK
nr:DNA/RNA non-specific endonuclease [Acidobacteriota bacterium]